MEPTYSKTTISATAAQVITTACIRKTAELDGPVAVVVVDEDGAMKTLIRMDEVPAFHATTAHDLATAALGGGRSADHGGSSTGAIDGDAGVNGSRRSAGGHLLVVDSQVVGAIGVSGAGAADDAAIAAAGVEAMSSFVQELGMLVSDAHD